MADNQTTDCKQLADILAVVGYSDTVPSCERYTLLSAIMLFTSSNGRLEIETRCKAMMKAIREENADA